MPEYFKKKFHKRHNRSQVVEKDSRIEKDSKKIVSFESEENNNDNQSSKRQHVFSVACRNIQ